MSVRIEKAGPVWTVIHDRPEARNAMDPESADRLTAAFLEFDADRDASVAVFYGAGGAFCAGWDLNYVSTLNADYPLGELDIPIAGPRASSSAFSRAPPLAVTYSHRPMVTHSSAGTLRPVRIISSARPCPTMRGNRTVPPSINGTPQRRQ